MSANISETIRNISDSEAAEIDIYLKNGMTERLNCVFKESDPPSFFLAFPPKKLPENIDMDKLCPVSIKVDKNTVTLTAAITKVAGDRTLELVAKKTITPESLREYFRVSAHIDMIANYTPETMEHNNKSWTIEGKTIDISGSGILTILPSDPANNHKIELRLNLDEKHNCVTCIGHIVRKKRLRRGSYQVAFHFDSIKPKHRDAIISFCLREQRYQLREKVKTKET